MIEKLIVHGFRTLKDFEWEPTNGVNIVAGPNSIGKSTLLDAIEIVTKGTLKGQRVKGNISPDWFNADTVSSFFSLVQTNGIEKPPEIVIEAIFAGDCALASLEGCNGPDGRCESVAGLWYKIAVPEELTAQFLVAARQTLDDGWGIDALPIEYYECTWKSCKGDLIIRRPNCLSVSRVDVAPESKLRMVDSYTRSLVEDALDSNQLRDISSKMRRARASIDSDILSNILLGDTNDSLELRTDKSPKYDWKAALSLTKGGIPLAALGSGDQIMVKAGISLKSNEESSILLMEEPESHLSHTTLFKLISLIENNARDGSRQVFLTTHSPFVLNRLGLNRLFVMGPNNTVITLDELSSDTVTYFKRLSGYDTLRIILAQKAVLVEGPTDEMVFEWAFRKLRHCMPADLGIDVIEYGIRYKRAFELVRAARIEPFAVLRDNDDKDEKHWQEGVSEFISEKRRLFTGHDNEGRTIEPQMVKANIGQLDLLAEIVGSKKRDESGLTEYLSNNKTDWALRLLEADQNKSEDLRIPRYIAEAIEFISPISNTDE